MATHDHTVMGELGLLLRAFVDRRSPTLAKALAIAGLLYGASPIDLIPDFIPLLGQGDDVVIIVAILIVFLRMTEKVREALRNEDSR